VISSGTGHVAVRAIPADEEFMVSRSVARVLKLVASLGNRS